MIIPLEFELPFARCKDCMAFEPTVTDRQYVYNNDRRVTCSRKLTCDGYALCEYLAEHLFKENEND